MVIPSQKKHAEYLSIVERLLFSESVQRLDHLKHHYGVSRMHHVINVSYYSYFLCKKLRWDYRAAARAGLLHDLFHYDCKVKRFGPLRHAAIHPLLALRNAERLTALSEKERDIIRSHMWLCGKAVPRCKEAYLVSLVDKYSAVYECIYGICQKMTHIFQSKTI